MIDVIKKGNPAGRPLDLPGFARGGNETLLLNSVKIRRKRLVAGGDTAVYRPRRG